MAKKANRFEHRDSKNGKQKWCPRCKKWRLLKHFTKNRRQYDGFAGWCRDCSNEYHNEYNREKTREANAEKRRLLKEAKRAGL